MASKHMKKLRHCPERATSTEIYTAGALVTLVTLRPAGYDPGDTLVGGLEVPVRTGLLSSPRVRHVAKMIRVAFNSILGGRLVWC